LINIIMANAVSKSIRVLPVALRVKIFSYSLENSPKDLFNLVTSCKELHETFENNREKVLPAFLSRLLDSKELAIATAHYFATIAPWKCVKDLDVPAPQNREEYLEHVTAFCDKHLSKQGTELRTLKTDFTLPMVAHIVDIHNAISDLAKTMAPKIVACRHLQPNPTPVELAKVTKSLYVFDLVSILFPMSPVSARQHASDDISEHDHAFTKFWTCFAP
jgi:hypothetical protein